MGVRNVRGGVTRADAASTAAHRPRRLLGSSDLLVSEICLGSMTWGKQNTELEAHAQLSHAMERGVNFIDTAEMYPVPAEANTQVCAKKR